MAIDFSSINDHALQRLEALIGYLAPPGVISRSGLELFFHNPTRADKRPTSLSINRLSGAWRDRALSDAFGRDCVSLWSYIYGIGQSQAARELSQWLRVPIQEGPRRENVVPFPSRQSACRDDSVAKMARARALWAEGKDPSFTVCDQYLWNERRLELEPDACTRVLRFHPSLYLNPAHPSLPGMLAAFYPLAGDFEDGAEPCGIQRWWLPDGRCLRGPDGKRRKKCLGRVGNAAVKLSGDSEIAQGLGVCEGVETGLALLNVGWGPIWSLGSAGGIETLPVLNGIETLTIYADNDINGVGQRAAELCRDRWVAQGREVIIRMPPDLGSDWADVLTASPPPVIRDIDRAREEEIS